MKAFLAAIALVTLLTGLPAKAPPNSTAPYVYCFPNLTTKTGAMKCVKVPARIGRVIEFGRRAGDTDR